MAANRLRHKKLSKTHFNIPFFCFEKILLLIRLIQKGGGNEQGSLCSRVALGDAPTLSHNDKRSTKTFLCNSRVSLHTVFGFVQVFDFLVIDSLFRGVTTAKLSD